MKNHPITVFLSLTLMTACLFGGALAAQTENPAPAPGAVPDSAPPVEYRLQKEDIMRISVWGEPNMDTQQAVDPQGYIILPLLGYMHVEGMTQVELTKHISDGLKKYLREPKVKIEIMQFRKPKVHVMGYVYRAGVHEFKHGDRVMEAIAKGGSYMENADLRNAKLTRGGKDIPLDLEKLFYENDLSLNIELQDGDVIYLPEDTLNYFTVAGEVLRQGQFKLKKDTTVWQAISTAGGPTERASLKSTYILRGDLENPQRIQVDIDKYLKKAEISQNPPLLPGDVIYVSETRKPNWDKISRVLSALVNSTYLFRILGR